MIIHVLYTYSACTVHVQSIYYYYKTLIVIMILAVIQITYQFFQHRHNITDLSNHGRNRSVQGGDQDRHHISNIYSGNDRSIMIEFPIVSLLQ